MSVQTESVTRLIWEWPLRCWHWLFAVSVIASLTTGLAGEIDLMEWHLRFGYCACGLLIFRFVWGLIGGTHSRWSQYQVSPAAFINHFRRGTDNLAHTAPGIGLALFLLLAVLLQTVSGLYTTDDIFIEGPLVAGASDELVSTLTALHHRVFWAVIAAIAIHLTAHVVYALRGSSVPVSMFSGRKAVSADVPAAEASGIRAVVLAALAGLLVWGGLTLLA